MASQWQQDAPANLVELAVSKSLIAEMDDSRWTEIGLLTGTKEQIYKHPRLLRSLRFGDEDYDGHAYDMVPVLLGAQETWETPVPSKDIHARFPRLGMVADFIDLPAWLALNEPDLYGRLFVDDHVEATLPDGTVLSEAESAAVRLGVAEMRRQVERIRRDYANDPEAAIGQAKGADRERLQDDSGHHRRQRREARRARPREADAPSSRPRPDPGRHRSR